MINQIHLKNFKPHLDTTLSLGKFTLLCGQNGVGKSSVLQSLLLLRQSFQKSRLGVGLSLNKPLCYIGKGIDLLYQYAETDKIGINLQLGNKLFTAVFDTEESLESNFLKIIEQESSLRNEIVHNTEVMQTALFKNNFQYISANRGILYESDDYAVEQERQLSIEEGKSELTAHFLYKYQREIVSDELLHPATPENATQVDKTLLVQATLWEREISKGVNIHPKKVGNSYEIFYSFENEKGYTNEFSANNVGFGISYSLPVIVAILASKKDALLLIENPEAHLHPYGQAKLAELMCIAAQAGIQIIVETHSDHIVNGVLVQCKRFEQESQGINRENVKIHYFEKTEDNTACKATEVEILENGKLRNNPQGFFDQIGKDLRYLMRTNSKKNG